MVRARLLPNEEIAAESDFTRTPECHTRSRFNYHRVVCRWIQAMVIAAAAMAAFVPADGATIERRFSTTVYPQLQAVLTRLSNAVPFALFDLLTIAGAAAVVTTLIRGWRRTRRERRLRPVMRA